ncbi:MAG: hypothetical protein RBS43_01385 [Candidatus Cloacimonas sp.]|nr:hypothetical protein [Candidatus Cloacimonas sp.]
MNCSEPVTLDIKGFQQQVIAYEVKCLKEEASNQLKIINDEDRSLMLKVDLSKISKDELIELIRKL